MLKKIIKKDKNEELEQILEEKNVDEQAKNLLQGILYKIEVSYNDYQKVKGINQTEEQYVDQLLLNIKRRCNNIKVVKVSQRLEEKELEHELRTKKFYVNETDIISYPIERKLLYAIEKKANYKKILNNKYEEITIAVSNFINMGKNIDRIEVLRDFNGWSWTTVKSEIENIDANLIYQTLQILYGKEFLDNWCKDKDGIVDYFEVMKNEGSKYNKNAVKQIKELLIKISIINTIKENSEFAKEISEKIEIINKELVDYENSESYIKRISEHKMQVMKELKETEKILGQKARLMAEYEKRNRDDSNDKKIFNINILKKELNEKKKKLLNEICEDNYFLNPANYIKEKKKLEDKKNAIDLIEITEEQKQELIHQFIHNFLQCFNIKIEDCTEHEEILKMIYQFRYFVCLPIDEKNSIKDIKELEKDIEKTGKLLMKKAIENKIIAKVPYDVMKHVYETRIILLEELYYKITKENEKNYVQIFDKNVSEEKYEIKLVEKIKLNKKIKIFT